MRICKVMIFIAVTLFIFLELYFFPKKSVMFDQFEHFYDMKTYYDSKKIPVTGARLSATPIIDEFLNTPKVPGGAYYMLYTLCYKLGLYNFENAKFINLLFNSLIVFIFLIWFYKRFGIFVSAMFGAILLCNPYLLSANIDFWNPNTTLIFSFLFLIALVEYIGNNNEKIVKCAAVIIFPVLGIMAQCHLMTFFSMVPTVIIYLIISFRRTKKYIKYLVLGVFISFLEYLPYIITEIVNGFVNTKGIFAFRSGFSGISFPPLHALFIFPTNEMSIMFGGRWNGIVYFWLSKPFYTIGIIFLIFSLIFSLFCFIRALYFVLNIKYSPKSDNEKVLIETLKIFFLFIPITVMSLIIFKVKSGPLYYLYSAFSMSFLPIVLFFVQNENKILKNRLYLKALSICLILNMFSLSFQMMRYFSEYEEPHNMLNMKSIYKTLSEESKKYGDIAVIDMYRGRHNYEHRDISITFFSNYLVNENSNSTNVYILFDRLNSFNRNRDDVKINIAYINSNSKIINSNTRLILYKYYGKLPPKFPNNY